VLSGSTEATIKNDVRGAWKGMANQQVDGRNCRGKEHVGKHVEGSTNAQIHGWQK